MASPNCVGKLTSITDIHPEIIQTQILSRIHGPDLASTASTSPFLHSLCSKEKVWTDMCNSTWTSTKHPLVSQVISTFPGGHRSFFSDSFPVLLPGHTRNSHRSCCKLVKLTAVISWKSYRRKTNLLISAVDIKYKHNLIYSRVGVTNTDTNSFLESSFRVEVLNPKDSIIIPENFERHDDTYLSDLKEYMTLSWIMIDPALKRAINVSSVWPVSVRPHWVGGHIELKYATLTAGGGWFGMSKLVEFRIVAMLGWKEGGELELTKVNFQVQDMDSQYLSGRDSLGILLEGLECGKRRKGKKGEETERYRKYVEMKRKRRERKDRRKPVGAVTRFLALVFLALCAFVILQWA